MYRKALSPPPPLPPLPEPVETVPTHYWGTRPTPQPPPSIPRHAYCWCCGSLLPVPGQCYCTMCGAAVPQTDPTKSPVRPAGDFGHPSESTLRYMERTVRYNMVRRGPNLM
eukprot:TRINITY_DN39260_c0_g1_i1.p1 TRINITY_DN39260_c0_g1~~TRINITY_DN39260_c0_g1_i1.p1  ORF type:complete len:111 (+),score=5.65 TRINITY_DN39260_c0_g1_i1:74-406(+)